MGRPTTGRRRGQEVCKGEDGPRTGGHPSHAALLEEVEEKPDGSMEVRRLP